MLYRTPIDQLTMMIFSVFCAVPNYYDLSTYFTYLLIEVLLSE